jgi:DNA-binding MarR family transcriptional regulator
MAVRRASPGRFRDLSQAEYAALARFRARLRGFLRFTEREARSVGLTPQQHQLLLAVRAREDGAATVGQLAEALHLEHHTTVELVDRAAAVGAVRRAADPSDRRRVLVRLTAAGKRALTRLSLRHRRELRALRRALDLALLGEEPRTTGSPAWPPRLSLVKRRRAGRTGKPRPRRRPPSGPHPARG